MNTPETDKDFSKIFHNIIDDGTWAKLSFKAQAVYPVLLRHARYNSRKAYPTVLTVAKLAGVSIDSAREGINEIRQSGYIDKKRGGAGIGYRNIYTVYKKRSPALPILSTSREKTVKCSYAKDPKTGKFIPIGEKNRDPIREKTVTNTSRENSRKKESKEIIDRDNAGSSSSSHSEASPASSLLQSYIGRTINLDELRPLLALHCKNEVIERIRAGEIKLKEGVDLDAVINSTKTAF